MSGVKGNVFDKILRILKVQTAENILTRHTNYFFFVLAVIFRLFETSLGHAVLRYKSGQNEKLANNHKLNIYIKYSTIIVTKMQEM
jgi:hypothetical protein